VKIVTAITLRVQKKGKLPPSPATPSPNPRTNPGRLHSKLDTPGSVVHESTKTPETCKKKHANRLFRFLSRARRRYFGLSMTFTSLSDSLETRCIARLEAH
jgi:hypothetical protein